MVDTIWFGQIDGSDLSGAKEDTVVAVGDARSNSNAFAAEGLRHFPEPALEADIVLGGGDRAYDLVLIVFHFRQAIRHRSEARSIAMGRYLLTKRLVRTLEIVDGPPPIKCAVHFGAIAKAMELERLRIERAVEAFVVAAAMRVIWPAVHKLEP